jgi:DNA-binding protein HU-beta
MTKADLVTRIAQDSDISKKAAESALNCMVQTILESLKEHGEIRIDRLGTFKVIERKARTGVNPRNGSKIDIPATKAPTFRAAQALKDAVKNVK